MPILLLERPACSIFPLDDRVIIRKLLTQRREERIPMSAHPPVRLVPVLSNFRRLNTLNGKASCFLHRSRYLQSFQAFAHSMRKPHIEFHALLPCFHRLAHSCKNNGGCTPSVRQNSLAGARPRSTQSPTLPGSTILCFPLSVSGPSFLPSSRRGAKLV